MKRRGPSGLWIPPAVLLVLVLLLSVPLLRCPACRGGPHVPFESDNANWSYAFFLCCERCHGGLWGEFAWSAAGRHWPCGRVSVWERAMWRTRETDWHDRDGRTAAHPSAAVRPKPRVVKPRIKRSLKVAKPAGGVLGSPP